MTSGNRKKFDSFEKAIDSLVNRAFECWADDPLKPPLFVFTCRETEKWFKMHLLRMRKKAGNACAMMNIRTMLLDRFACGLKNSGRRRPDADELRDLIAFKLLSSYEGQPYYKTLGKDVVRFIESSVIKVNDNAEYNPVNLYDISSTLASLFIKYSNELIMNSKKELQNNKWQKGLYKDINEIIQNNFVNYAPLNDAASFAEAGNIHVDQPVFFLRNAAEKISAENEKLVLTLKENFYEYEVEIPADTKTDKFVRLISAPGKTREIEGIHSEICRLVKEGKIDNFDDILVLAPDMSEYRTAVHRVFTLAKYSDGSFPYIPVQFSDSMRCESSVAECVKLLFAVARKGYYTRSDFFTIANNSVVTAKLKIEEDNLENWKKWVNELCVYRNRTESPDDWKQAEERLLLSSMMNADYDGDSVEKSIFTFNPLFDSQISSRDRFCELIDFLDDWCRFFRGKTELKLSDEKEPSAAVPGGSGDDFADIVHRLDFLFDVSAAMSEDETAGEVSVYREIRCRIFRLRQLQNVFVKSNGVEKGRGMDIRLFIFSVCDSPGRVSLFDSESVFGGVRFASFNPDCTVPCKYLFLISAGANTLCLNNQENVLDIAADNRDFKAALEAQIAASNGFYVSFINADLAKDETFYLSPVLEAILKDYGFYYRRELKENGKEQFDKENKLIVMKIDEDRDDGSLWTETEFRNKKCGVLLSQSLSVKEREYYETENNVLPDMVKISDIKEFLNDPLQFYSKVLFGKDYDDDDTDNGKFEPIELNFLQKSDSEKELIKKLYDVDFTEAEDVRDMVFGSDDYKLKLRKHIITDAVFGKAAYSGVIDELFSVKKEGKKDSSEENKSKMENIKSVLGDKPVFDYKVDAEFNFSCSNNDGNLVKWRLTGETCWHNALWKETGELRVLNYSSNIISAYITALCLIADSGENETDYNVVCYDKDVKENSKISFTIKKADAAEILNSVYKAMFVESYHKCVPYNFIKEKKEFRTFSEFESELTSQNGPWKNFTKKAVFIAERDTGFSTDGGFAREWNEAVEHQQDFFCYLRGNDE